jgi:hypothetical protein
MKKIIILVALLCPILSFAQEFTGQTYIQQKDSLLNQLDKTKLPHGNLYDRVFPWANLDILDTDTDTLDNKFFAIPMNIKSFKATARRNKPALVKFLKNVKF